jgi:CBS domain-containing protein
MGVVTFGDVYHRLEPAQALFLLRTYGFNEQLPIELGQKPILEFATRPVQTIPTSTPILEALHLLLTQQFKRLPVVNEAGEIIGFLGRTIQ